MYKDCLAQFMNTMKLKMNEHLILSIRSIAHRSLGWECTADNFLWELRVPLEVSAVPFHPSDLWVVLIKEIVVNSCPHSCIKVKAKYIKSVNYKNSKCNQHLLFTSTTLNPFNNRLRYII